MSKESFEHLSCLMDGEISKDTGRFLVRRLGSDSELRATWTRYHVIRDCLRHHEGNLAGDEFSGKVQAALLDDVSPAVTRSLSAKWLKPVSGFAIAASVALMAIVTVDPTQSPLTAPADGLVESSALESFVSTETGLGFRPVSQAVNMSPRINSYLLRHNQVAGFAGGKGFVAFVPMVVAQNSEAPEDDYISQDEEKNLDNGKQPTQR